MHVLKQGMNINQMIDPSEGRLAVQTAEWRRRRGPQCVDNGAARQQRKNSRGQRVGVGGQTLACLKFQGNRERLTWAEARAVLTK